MTTIVVLFNLQAGVDENVYRQWATETDIPTAGGLASVESFEVLKSEGVLMSETTPPYQYIEILKINDMDQFGQDVATATMQKVASEFQQFADNPIFIMTSKL
ncbi:hypothetical protein [Paraglaciecola polaris]|uniref:REDY-like protein HapK n=1 Tax=Paraglaciecola polaris LMG 21857 TaxID=1129793 RepID=K6ZU40_9ALTE|nr:hypothetical protein [Paraglaciecola polaris]GAC32323.1 hypothetical protein GPLA_1409 [Paraglaciecola polaris LMG 21857]|tara:strand:- start:6060 stop:6368 length:309 start_codon:yes stop_codon:yes gene_type:complete